ncbi:tRNA (adenosine(37)-N6)-threonylcarbamoyltransferase complex dimerization subunit type 1 TsaB [Paenibacillus sp. 481]|uniref:tRNA (adenosine(37)-N6)-threonylcarbamoyltransferase complex dimerization subunit type 1 TsaB n=1 Tax=Paenibacillus sp. 481 TaxID=2835869 RepID=UPI001E4B4A90|nr:tRNA (adenosine(37)-N6)-threonylcarbamoyltransferase complex dimerization subunit type 1 TsaB [Paenibacillus sp. 481]UHA71986.1 tRNA (adenosine(37)-N6)-threonylcarbamoyltransferase complex dimerization subunit type 1 TsaB [Paenibacillus sp. 481]
MMEQQAVQLLAIDTSTNVLAVAALRGSGMAPLANLQSEAERNHAIKLVPAMQAMIRDLGWTQDDVNVLAVGIGPGSYTGVRVAVTAAKTLAWAWRKPVVGVSSLHALALSGWEAAQQHMEQAQGSVWVYPLMDARRGQAYTARFAFEHGERAAVDSLGVRQNEDSIRLVASVVEEAEVLLAHNEGQPQAQVWLVGDVEPHRELLEALQAKLGSRVRIVGCKLSAAWIGRLALADLERGVPTADIHQLEPNYAQLTEAETKLLAKEREERAARANDVASSSPS